MYKVRTKIGEIALDFFIQASNPKCLAGTYSDNNESLADAVEDMFPLETEDAFLVWNHIYVPISYKYDVSYMIEDIVCILKKIQTNETGCMSVHWLPDTFRCDWEIEWSHEEIGIISHWESTVGNLEDLLNSKGSVKMPVDRFVSEWKKLLGIVIDGLKCNGYREKELKGMEELIDVYEKITDVGFLYRKG